MKINSVTLYNFGSYEGENFFDVQINDNQNIILIGGKNGAGKTTLFTAIRICLYSYMSMGHKNFNSYYSKAVSKLINNTAKIKKPTQSSVSLHLSLEGAHDVDNYIIKRSWTLNTTLVEQFHVIKNGKELSESETHDFEKYLLSLIPFELFNLYFFDGEKISDFFMNEGSHKHLKKAFLTISGYNTFEIMHSNFKRLSMQTSNVTPALNEYLELSEKLSVEANRLNEYLHDKDRCSTEIELCDDKIVAIDNGFIKDGGITEHERTECIASLKLEEKSRDDYNLKIKKWANDIIPFLMIKNNLTAIKEQIANENDNMKLEHIKEVLFDNGLCKQLSSKHGSLAHTIVHDIDLFASNKYNNSVEQILNLSFEQSSSTLFVIDQLLNFDTEQVLATKNMIKKSIRRSAKIRETLEQTNFNSYQKYMDDKTSFLEDKNKLLQQYIELEQISEQQSQLVLMLENQVNKLLATLETELKNKSINDIATKSIIMLEKLNELLYKSQIEKVECQFRQNINRLIRKSNFIDDIKIDNNFNISIYKNEAFSRTQLLSMVEQYNSEQFVSILGENALMALKTFYGVVEYNQLSKRIDTNMDEVILPVEVDKTSLSNGEKQIFIMALYHSLVSICSLKIPFIIDTPFARIDTEHRYNISEQFFKELKGQVFILSTNEEINDKHIELLNNKIAKTYLLENSDNKKTLISSDSYFGANNGI